MKYSGDESKMVWEDGARVSSIVHSTIASYGLPRYASIFQVKVLVIVETCPLTPNSEGIHDSHIYRIPAICTDTGLWRIVPYDSAYLTIRIIEVAERIE